VRAAGERRHVLVDGRVLKRGGQLTAVEPRAVAEAGTRSLAEVLGRAGWSGA
jgi:hypothetical protein